jgi:hypothetical protein
LFVGEITHAATPECLRRECALFPGNRPSR